MAGFIVFSIAVVITALVFAGIDGIGGDYRDYYNNDHSDKRDDR